jgi:hypothetical protein
VEDPLDRDQELSLPTVRKIYSTFYLVLGIGITWASMTQDRVNYPSWALVGPNEFKNFHHAVLVGTQTYIIPFALLGLLAGIPMIWLRHPAISRNLVIFVLAIGALGAVVTTRMAIPIQKQMYREDPSHIPALVQQLIAVDLYWRIFPGLLALAALAVMVYQLANAASTQPKT